MSFKIKEKFGFQKNNGIYSHYIGSKIEMYFVGNKINEYLLDGKENKFDSIDQKMKNLKEGNIYETWNLINEAIDFASRHLRQNYPDGASKHFLSIFNQALKRKSIFLEKVKSLIPN